MSRCSGLSHRCERQPCRSQKATARPGGAGAAKRRQQVNPGATAGVRVISIYRRRRRALRHIQCHQCHFKNKGCKCIVTKSLPALNTGNIKYVSIWSPKTDLRDSIRQMPPQKQGCQNASSPNRWLQSLPAIYQVSRHCPKLIFKIAFGIQMALSCSSRSMSWQTHRFRPRRGKHAEKQENMRTQVGGRSYTTSPTGPSCRLDSCVSRISIRQAAL